MKDIKTEDITISNGYSIQGFKDDGLAHYYILIDNDNTLFLLVKKIGITIPYVYPISLFSVGDTSYITVDEYEDIVIELLQYDGDIPKKALRDFFKYLTPANTDIIKSLSDDLGNRKGKLCYLINDLSIQLEYSVVNDKIIFNDESGVSVIYFRVGATEYMIARNTTSLLMKDLFSEIQEMHSISVFS